MTMCNGIGTKGFITPTVKSSDDTIANATAPAIIHAISVALVGRILKAYNVIYMAKVPDNMTPCHITSCG
jgi:hypothetical protein